MVGITSWQENVYDDACNMIYQQKSYKLKRECLSDICNINYLKKWIAMTREKCVDNFYSWCVFRCHHQFRPVLRTEDQ